MVASSAVMRAWGAAHTTGSTANASSVRPGPTQAPYPPPRETRSTHTQLESCGRVVDVCAAVQQTGRMDRFFNAVGSPAGEEEGEEDELGEAHVTRRHVSAAAAAAAIVSRRRA